MTSTLRVKGQKGNKRSSPGTTIHSSSNICIENVKGTHVQQQNVNVPVYSLKSPLSSADFTLYYPIHWVVGVNIFYWEEKDWAQHTT